MLASLFQFSDVAYRAIIPRTFALIVGKFVGTVQTVAVLFVLGVLVAISHRKIYKKWGSSL